jgi:hypothetical protein
MAIGQALMDGKPDGNTDTARGIRGLVIMEQDTERDMVVPPSIAGTGCDARARDIGRSLMATRSQLQAMRRKLQEAMRRKLRDSHHNG